MGSNVQYDAPSESWQEFFQAISESTIERRNVNVGSSAVTNEWTTLTRRKSLNASQFQLPHEPESGDSLIANVSEAPNIDVLNATLMYQRMSRELDQMKNLRDAVTSLKTFIFKVTNALNSEKKFKKTAQYYEHCPDDLNLDDLTTAIKLPKLGKVYAELTSCMKACNETTVNLLESSSSTIHKLDHLRQQCNMWRGKTLLYVKWLILSRLENIGLLTHLYTKAQINHSDIFHTAENKRFCKLIEIYNKFSSEHVKQLEFKRPLEKMYVTRLTESNTGQSVITQWKNLSERSRFLDECVPHVSDISPIALNVVLDSLSKYSVKDLARVVMKVLEVSLVDGCAASQSGASQLDVIKQGHTWNLASKIEIRPMQSKGHTSFHKVIKRVANITIPDTIISQSTDYCQSVMELFDSQKRVLHNFLDGLGGKTKILQHFSETGPTDDAMSVASASSRASSSLAHSMEFKSVSWKDSSNSEAIKSVTSKHLDSVVASLPNRCADYRKAGFLSSDKDLIVMQAAVVNLKCLDILSIQMHNSITTAASHAVANAALSCSDGIACEMLGSMTPHFDKPSLQHSLDVNDRLSVSTSLCVSALQPLLHIVESYPNLDVTSKTGIPSILSILTCGYQFVDSKIEHSSSAKDLPPVLTFALTDLRILTNVAIESLKIVETCHNEIEKRRDQNSATLILTTKYLRDIDTLITRMQITSTTTMSRMSEIASKACTEILERYFPPQKVWMQKSSIDTEVKNVYVKEINGLMTSVCKALTGMDAQFQLAGIVPVVSAVFQAILKYIATLRTKFSVQGGLQFQYDVTVLIEFLSSQNNGLLESARHVIPSLQPVKRIIEVTKLLCTAHMSSAGSDNRYHRPSSRTYSVAESENAIDLDDDFWLSLRKDGKEAKKWKSLLPCLD